MARFIKLKGEYMNKVGRPKLPEEDKVKNQRISVDYQTYQNTLVLSRKHNKTIKNVIKEAILDKM